MATVPLVLLLHGVFVSALLAIPLPLNVTVQCRNFENVVYWNYSASDLPAYFNVNVYRYVSSSPHTVNSCSNTTQHYCDISQETREVEEHYYASVTAMVGSNVSEEADSPQFTYYKFFDGHLCSVDFPPVNVSFKEDRMVLSFQHPYKFYRKTLKHVKNKGEYRMFHFSIQYGNESGHLTTSCDLKSPCEEAIPMEDGVELVQLWGLMNGINLTSSKVISNKPSREERNYLMMYLALVTFVVILLIAWICILSYRQLTRSSPFPKTIVSLLTSSRRETSILSPERPNTEVVQPADSPVSKTLLLPDDDDTDCWPIADAPQDCSRFPIGVGISDDMSNSSSGSGSETRSSEANRSTSEAFTSGYNQPKQLGFEMAPGDTVLGYRD